MPTPEDVGGLSGTGPRRLEEAAIAASTESEGFA
jgi:hypothetical protein